MTHLPAQYFGIANVTAESFDVVDQQTYLSTVNHHFGLNTQTAASVQGDMHSLAFHSPAAHAHLVTLIEGGAPLTAKDPVAFVEEVVAEKVETPPESVEEHAEVEQEVDTDD